MRALIQRVRHAEVSVEGEIVGSCGQGYLVFLGVAPTDTCDTAQKMWAKILGLRICADEEGKTNKSLADVGGELLVVSQFTLYANCKRGKRPSFTDAADPALARELYEYMVGLAVEDLGKEHVGTGIFGADMNVSLTNDGPFTIYLDSTELGF